jgi:hypothetical protein
MVRAFDHRDRVDLHVSEVLERTACAAEAASEGCFAQQTLRGEYEAPRVSSIDDAGWRRWHRGILSGHPMPSENGEEDHTSTERRASTRAGSVSIL